MSYYLNPNVGTNNYHTPFLTVLNKIKVSENIVIYKLGFQPKDTNISVSARIYDSEKKT